ncbi:MULTISPECIES: hypothetical protein [Rhodanobacter]|uniref:Uncharacterized protein n=1 Tax=Rhodanobacter hydrolyticus TaxID=2250595 RepID=A0ABW8J839_9GAMM|nr:hypothetical protein [Rhodanobacter sp. 7MK24]MBD8879864.1 hypothetical protein [Rhodanobacter sp. 7MK24]
MRKRYVLANAMLWAAAMLAAAVLKAPNFLTVLLLPMLATLSTLVARRPEFCLNRSDLS